MLNETFSADLLVFGSIGLFYADLNPTHTACPFLIKT